MKYFVLKFEISSKDGTYISINSRGLSSLFTERVWNGCGRLCFYNHFYRLLMEGRGEMMMHMK